MSDENRLEAQFQAHRADIAEKIADLKVDMHDRIERKFRVGGIVGAVAALGLLFTLLAQVNAEFTSPMVKALIERRLSEPLEDLAAGVDRLERRERITQLADSAIANDEAGAYDELLATDDPEHVDALEAARERVFAHVIANHWTTKEMVRQNSRSFESDEQAFKAMAAAETPWARIVAANFLARGQHGGRDDALAGRWLSALRSEESLLARSDIGGDFYRRFLAEPGEAPVVNADPEDLRDKYEEKWGEGTLSPAGEK